MFCAILSYPILSYLVLSFLVLFLSYPVLLYPALLSYSILSYPIISFAILPCPELSCSILSYLILRYPILSYNKKKPYWITCSVENPVSFDCVGGLSPNSTRTFDLCTWCNIWWKYDCDGGMTIINSTDEKWRKSYDGAPSFDVKTHDSKWWADATWGAWIS